MLYPVQGAKFYVQTAIDSAVTVTGATNADPTVLTATAHGYVDNDEVMVVSGWDDVNYSVFRVNQLTTNTFELPDMDTSDTDWYPVGGGAGTAQKITTWQELGQVIAVTNSGGGPRNITTNLLNKRRPNVTPVGFEASTLSFTLGYDPAQTDQVELRDASRRLLKRAFKFVLPGGSYAYCYGTVSMSDLPTFDANSVMQVSVTVGIDGLFTFF